LLLAAVCAFLVGTQSIYATSLTGATAAAADAAKRQMPDQTPEGGDERLISLEQMTGQARVVVDASGPLMSGFELPTGAAQGPDSWYTLRIVGTLEPPEGDVTIEAATNEAAVMQYRATQVSDGLYRVIALGLVSGRQNEERHAPIAFRYENYLQDAGVRAGTNNLRLHLRSESAGEPRLLIDGAQSGIVATTASPSELVLRTPVQSIVGAEDTSIVVPIELFRKGRRPDVPLEIRVDAPSGIEVEQVPEVKSIGDGRRLRLRVRVAEAGTYSVRIALAGAYNEPAGLVQLTVRRGPLLPEWVPAVGAASAVAAAYLLLTRTRQRRWLPRGRRVDSV
jgi:hypothetical protein